MIKMNNPFVGEVARGLKIVNNEKMKVQDIQELEKNLAMCTLSYYFSKIHFTYLKNTLEDRFPRIKVDEEIVNQYVEKINEKMKKGEAVKPLKIKRQLSIENKAMAEDSVVNIESELEKSRFLDITPEEVEEKFKLGNYLDYYKNIEGAKDYFLLKGKNIESYLQSEVQITKRK